MTEILKKSIAQERCDRFILWMLCGAVMFLPISPAGLETFAVLAILGFSVKKCFLFYETGRSAAAPKTHPLLRFILSFRPDIGPVRQHVGLFLLVLLITVPFSVYPLMSLEAFFKKWLEVVVLMCVLVECVRTRERLSVFLAAFGASFAVVLINGFFQYFYRFGFLRQMEAMNGWLFSSFQHSNNYAAYLLVAVFLGLGVLAGSWARSDRTWPALWYRKKARLLSLAVGAGGLISLGLTFSRGAWLGFVLGLFYAGLKEKKVLLFLAVLMVVFVGVLSPKLEAVGKRGLFDKMTYLNASGRSIYWQEAANIIKDYPVTGTGINTYSLVGRDYKIIWGGYPHNCYLQFTAETGLVGLAALLNLLFQVFRLVRAANRNVRRGSLDQGLLLAASAGLLAFLVHSFFDTQFYNTRLSALMWLSMGLVVAMSRLILSEKPS